MLNDKTLTTIEEQVKRLFRQNLESDRFAVEMTLRHNGKNVTPQLQESLDRIALLQAGTDVLYNLLSENEKIVIRYHYIQGLDWDCVNGEFEKRWGSGALKSKRSMINYQNKAFRKMAQYIQNNKNTYDFSWLERL